MEQKGNKTETTLGQSCDKLGTTECNKETRVDPANKGILVSKSTLQSNCTKTLTHVNTEHTNALKDNPYPECPRCLGEGCHMCWMAVWKLEWPETSSTSTTGLWLIAYGACAGTNYTRLAIRKYLIGLTTTAWRPRVEIFGQRKRFLGCCSAKDIQACGGFLK